MTVCSLCCEYPTTPLTDMGGGTLLCDNCHISGIADCGGCDNSFLIVHMTEVDGYYYCEDCLDETFYECADCGELSDKKDVTEIDNDSICPSCLSNDYFCCVCCEEYFSNDDACSVFDGSICQSCFDDHYFCCSSCDSATRQDQRVYVEGDDLELCESCFRENYTTCCDCGEVLAREDSVSVEDGDRCKDCAVVLPYHIKVPNVLNCNIYSRDHLVQLLGVELEVEIISGSYKDTAKQVLALAPKSYILKEDGSLAKGFEICSVPLSLEEHQIFWPTIWDNFPNNIRSWNTETCGMHVHASKKRLSSLQIGKILVFINSQKLRKYIVKIADRICPNYAAMERKKFTDVRKGTRKHESVSTCAYDTIEIRIFKGTLNLQSFLKNLEFTQALIEYTAPTKVSLRQVENWELFCVFVFKEKKRFPNLVKYMSRKGLLV